jgi:hypothetical protein
MDDRTAKVMQNLMQEDSRTQSKSSNEVDMRVPDESHVVLPSRGYRPKDTSKKELVIDGKSPLFHGPRALLAAGLLAIVALAGYGFVRWYIDTVISLDTAASSAGKKRALAVKSLATPKLTLSPAAQRLLEPTQTIAPGSTQTLASDSKRVVAPQTAQVGELVVGVSEARVDADGRLQIILRITNRSSKPLTYTSWSAVAINKPTLTDQFQNFYNLITTMTQYEQVIAPETTIIDNTLLFENPPPNGTLALDLPLGNEKFEFSLPTLFVRRVLTGFGQPAPLTKTEAPPAKAASAPPRVVAPYKAQDDPQLIADVKAVYKEAIKRVEKRILGMTSNNGARFRKNETKKIIQTIADKMGMTVEQISEMVSK